MVQRVKRDLIVRIFKVVVTVPISILIVVGVISYLSRGTGNQPVAVLTWVVTIPVLTVCLSRSISGKENVALKSLGSLLVFYGIVFFMIYEHYQTDVFKLIIGTLVFHSLLLLFAIIVDPVDFLSGGMGTSEEK